MTLPVKRLISWKHYAERGADRSCGFFDVDAIVEDGAVVDVVKPIDQIGDGGFSCPVAPTKATFSVQAWRRG